MGKKNASDVKRLPKLSNECVFSRINLVGCGAVASSWHDFDHVCSPGVEYNPLHLLIIRMTS